MLRIKLVRSLVGYNWRHREVARTLGLSRPNKFVYRQDIPSVRGAITKIKELVEVTVVDPSEVPVKKTPYGDKPKTTKTVAPAAEVAAPTEEEKPKRTRKPKATEAGQE